MEKRLLDIPDRLLTKHPELSVCRESILRAFETMRESFARGGKLLVAGNGGSCSDAQHIVGELMKGFKLQRRCGEGMKARLIAADPERGNALAEKLQGGLPAIALTEHQSLNTAFLNDVKDGGAYIPAQQTYGFGKEGDVFLGISTSGNSENIMNAAVVARALGLKVIALTGLHGGKIGAFADVAIRVPETETYLVQELHLPVYHCLCLMLEEAFFGEQSNEDRG